MDEFAVNYDPQSDISNNQFCFYNTPSTQNYAPNFGPNTAMLLTRNGQKVYHDSKIGSYSTWSYYCSAQFIGSDGNRLDAGVVEMHGYVDPPAFDSATFSPLPQHGDNFYSMKTNIQPGQFPQYFPGEIKWRASGAQWPAFNYTNTVGFPNRSVPQSGDPSISTDYIFQASPVANADSLVLQIFGQRHTITKTISADKSSKRFTSQELKK
ncbi:hypothetical protein CW751_09420 [Brumimicrobium salinarum]|uniref:Uncharacterized protein n=2 Tax=Brumimicrobium salinarum TaxID=2058658 RepID=A0A2I0R1Y1_9FLAO|nr:hypothetical protein CW751_09420 [Brumimicrobium salinarum]